MPDPFWDNVDKCLAALQSADTVDAVIAVLSHHFDPSSGEAFFGGSGGDTQVIDVLRESPNWTILWADAPYHFAAADSAGDALTYIEGDVYRGDDRA